MRPTPIACCVSAALALLIVVPAFATDETPSDKGNGLSRCDERYLNLYVKADQKFGHGAVGRNLVDDGLLGDRSRPEPIPTSRACSEGNQLHAMIHPPEPEPAVSYSEDVAAPPPATSTVTPSSVGNATVQCESGGDYGANTGNGYYGGYQFDSGTWDAYGDPAYGEANEAPPAIQDAAAGSVPYDAWPNC